MSLSKLTDSKETITINAKYDLLSSVSDVDCELNVDYREYKALGAWELRHTLVEERMKKHQSGSASAGGMIKLVNFSVKGAFSLDVESFLSNYTESERSMHVIVDQNHSVRVKCSTGKSVYVYQLVIEGPGISQRVPGLHIVAQPLSEAERTVTSVISVGLNADFDKLKPLFTLFSNTHPGKCNRGEWSLIRALLVSHAHLPMEQRFRALVELMGRICPGDCNRGEWAAIRSTCAQVLPQLDAGNPIAAVTMWLARMGDITPGRCNCGEWTNIRAQVKAINK